jgi:hypothetical protein
VTDAGESPPAPEPAKDESARRFESAADATSELHEHFGAWTAGLGKYGLQVAFALMAANWALHGSNTGLLQNPLAKWSMIIAVAYLGLLLLSMAFMVHQSWLRRQYADADKARWLEEFKAVATQPSAWPYTPSMERTGNVMAALHVLGPLLSGALLLVSIFVGSPKMPEAGSAGGGNGVPCCVRIGDDVAAIRHAVEDFTAAGTSDTASVIGESELRFPGWPIVSFGLLLALGGAATLWLVKGSRAQAVGASLMTMGLTCSAGGFALIKEIKVESIFSVKTDKLFDYVRKEVAGLGVTGPERLGFIDYFRLGDEQTLEISPGKTSDVRDSTAIGPMVDTWMTKRKEGTNAVLLVIGATDRLPISGEKRHQFEANVSLARARAETVKQALLDRCRNTPRCVMEADQVIALVSGPLHTPNAESSPPAAKRNGFPEDRRVDVWAIWTRKTDDAAKR